MPNFEPEALRGVYERYFDAAGAAALRDETRACVAEWRWAKELMLEAHPFEQQLFGTKPRWLGPGQAPKPGDLQHGLDAEGRIVLTVSPWFVGKRDDARATETVFIHAESEITSVALGPGASARDRNPESVCRYEYEHGRLVGFRSFRSGGGTELRLHWNEGVLTRSVQSAWKHGFFWPGSSDWAGVVRSWFIEHTYVYDDAGKLDCIYARYLDEDDRPNTKRKLEYRRPRKGETIAALSKKVGELLRVEIPRAIARAKVDVTAYCLLLCYCEEDFEAAWPPSLMIGAKTYRDSIVAAGEDVPYLCWAADEMRADENNRWLDLRTPELEEACRLHVQLMQVKGSFSAAKRLSRELAQELSRNPVPGLRLTTDDFIVAVVDSTGEVDACEDIKRSVSAEQWAKLEAQGLV